jgi:predicted nucleic acid-binding protein
MTVLLDTSFLLAVMNKRDANHARALKGLASLKRDRVRIVPAPVVYELFYMLTERVNYERAITSLELLTTAEFIIEPVAAEDMARIIQIMRQYASAAFDYTDTAIMALSERLNITQVYTFDQRDFRIFRPSHIAFLQLLPAE